MELLEERTRKINGKTNNNPKQQQDNEDGAVGDVSTSTNATPRDHDEAYLAWWLTRWGIWSVI